MLLHSGDDGIDAVNDLSRGFRVGNFQAVIFIECDHHLKRIHGIQPQAAGAKERLVVFDFIGRVLKHEVFHQHAFDLPFEFC